MGTSSGSLAFDLHSFRRKAGASEMNWAELDFNVLSPISAKIRFVNEQELHGRECAHFARLSPNRRHDVFTISTWPKEFSRPNFPELSRTRFVGCCVIFRFFAHSLALPDFGK
jgi:hypothetical protein